MRRATPAEVTAALHAVTVWPPELGRDPRSTPLTGIDVTAYAEAVRRRLGDPPARVGHSALLMGVASRLWSLSVVPAARDDVLVDPACLTVRHDDGAVVLGVTEPLGWVGPSADEVRDVVLEVLAPLVAALPLADRLLWGNAAASLHAVPRVHDLPQAAALVGSLLAVAPLAGEIEVGPDGTARRRTCCLFYEVPGAGLCGDCVLDRVPEPAGRR